MSTAENRPRYPLGKGPSKMDLMLGLFDNTSDNPRIVKFMIQDIFPVGSIALFDGDICGMIPVVINSIERESGSGEDWLFKGFTTQNSQVNGYFNTSKRTGWIEYDSIDTNEVKVNFGGSIIFGYDHAILINDKIVRIQGGEEQLNIGQTINIQGDSHGYVPGAVKAGSGTIIRFRLPYRHGVEDDLVMVPT